MRVVQVVNTMQVGGAEVLVAQLCPVLRRLGHEVQIQCLSGEGPLGERLREDGFEVASLPPLSPLQRIRRLAEMFRRTRPDAVHCHNIAPTVAGAPAARMAGVPRIISTRHSLVAPPHDYREELLYAVASHFCHQVVGICQATCENLRSIPLAPRRKLMCVYNGAIRQRDFDGAPTIKTGFTLVHVARLAAIKDQETLLRAVAIARTEIKDLSLWVIGDGALRSRLQQLACELGVANVVTFFGEQAKVAPYLAAADAFAMSSASEGLPMALLEAMSMGLPAIVTDVGGMAEVVRMADCGAIVPPGNPQAFASAICRLSRDPIQASAWGERARKSYAEQFELERMAERYIRIYRADA